MVKLKVLLPFFDKEINRKRLRNELFECSKKRAKEILIFDKYQLVEVLYIIRK